MFICASTLVLAVAATAIATPGMRPTTINQCNNGQLQCCNEAMTAPSSLVGTLGLDSNSMVGFGCNPLTVLGVGSGSRCSQTAVCCTGERTYGNQIISVDCSPVSLL